LEPRKDLVPDMILGGTTPKALKGNCVRNVAGCPGDDSDNDDDDLPPLLDILSAMKPKGAVEKGTLRLTQQPVGGSGLRGDLAEADTGTGAAGLKHGDSQGGYFTFSKLLSQVHLNRFY